MVRSLGAVVAVIFLFLGGASSASAAAQASVSVQLEASVESLPCNSGTLSISALDSTQTGKKATVFAEVDVPGTATTRLEPGTWRFSFTADRCWTQDVLVTVEPRESGHVRLMVFPSAIATGRLGLSPATESLDEITVAFAASFKDPGRPGPEGKVLCPVGSNRVFLCRIPSAKLDLRISAPGFAPFYKWEVEPPTESRWDLGTVVLTSGASLSGWLVTEDNVEISPKDIHVTLTPAGIAEAVNEGEERLRKAMTTAGVVGNNGFFQFRSLNPGEYILTVNSATYAQETVEVLVVEDRTSELRHPILLRPPVRTELVVDPPIDYYQRNWHIEILRLDRYRSHYERVSEGEVPSTGWYEATGVNPTTHLVKVTDSQGQQVFAKTYDFSQTPTPTVLEIGMVPVEGVVTLGDEPLEARIWFGGKHGAEKVETASDEKGLFGAILPRSGVWRVELESEDPPVRRKIADVEVDEWDGADLVAVNLQLPNTKIEGTVQTEDGAPPATTTLVYAVRGTWDRHVSVRVDRAGRFELLGLEEGVHEIYALSADSRSETRAVALQEDDERQVTLTLRKQKTVTGKVVTDDGTPVPGAFVIVQSADQPFLPAPQVSADGGGRFEAQVPGDTHSVNVTVGSPGRTLGVYRFDVHSTDEVLVTLPQQGGALEIQLKRGELQRLSGHALAVFRDGLPFAEGSIGWWSQIHKNDEEVASDSTIYLPSLVPGVYEACLVPHSAYPKWLLGYRQQELCGSDAVNLLARARVDLSKVTLGEGGDH